MTTRRITGWTAVRAGAGMTVQGKGPSGDPVKLTRVERIDSNPEGGAIAVRGDDRFQLA